MVNVYCQLDLESLRTNTSGSLRASKNLKGKLLWLIVYEGIQSSILAGRHGNGNMRQWSQLHPLLGGRHWNKPELGTYIMKISDFVMPCGVSILC